MLPRINFLDFNMRSKNNCINIISNNTEKNNVICIIIKRLLKQKEREEVDKMLSAFVLRQHMPNVSQVYIEVQMFIIILQSTSRC